MNLIDLAGLRLVEREQSFGNPWLANLIVGLQRVYLEPGEKTEAIEVPANIAPFSGNARLVLPTSDLSVFPGRLGSAVRQVLESLGETSLTAVTMFRCPWLQQPNEYPPVADILESLSTLFAGRDFDGGLQAELASVPSLIEAVFWLGRCANLSEIHLASPCSPWVMSICQYGVLHPEFYEPSVQSRFLEAARQSGFEEVAECREPFSSGAIPGRRIILDSGPQTDPESLASRAEDRSDYYWKVGRREEALAATQEAVGLYRGLAATCPDAFLPDLAGLLNSLSGRLSEVGRQEEAVAAIEEAVGFYRELAAVAPEAFLPQLAGGVALLSDSLWKGDRREEALTMTREAVCLYIDLARPDAFLPDLAMSLCSLSNRAGTLRQWREAMSAMEEAVEIYRGLATEDPETFLPLVASSLDSLSLYLLALGRGERALAASEEAVETYRGLVADGSEAFLSDLARSLEHSKLLRRTRYFAPGR